MKIKLILGAFFVYSRLAEPFHSIFINNRLHTTPLMEPVVTDIQLQEQAPFLLYRSQKNQIFGFWFYNKDDCKRIFNLINSIIKKTSQPVCDDINTTRPARKDDKDIFSMLEQAQINFKSNAHQPPSNLQTNEQHPHNQFHKMARKAEPKPDGNICSSDITAPNVASFFAAAQKPLKSNSSNNIDLVHKGQVVQKNVCPTVDEIEKLHRHVSISPKPPVLRTQDAPNVMKCNPFCK